MKKAPRTLSKDNARGAKVSSQNVSIDLPCHETVYFFKNMQRLR